MGPSLVDGPRCASRNTWVPHTHNIEGRKFARAAPYCVFVPLPCEFGDTLLVGGAMFSAEDLREIRNQIAEAHRVAARAFELGGIDEAAEQRLRLLRADNWSRGGGIRHSVNGAGRVVERRLADPDATQHA